MKKLQSKWYFSLVLIPILISYFTKKFDIDYLFDNCLYTIIGSLLFLLVILSYEMLLLKKEIRNLKNKPNENNQKIVYELIKKLDINNFENNIKDNDSWIGYDYSAIQKIRCFVDSSSLINNKVSDKELGGLIDKLRTSLEAFLRDCGEYLFMEDNNRIMPDKGTDFSYEKSKFNCLILNEDADTAFNDISKFRDYLIKKNYKIS